MQNGRVTVDPGVEAPLSDDERAARLDALTELMDLIRPAVQADGAISCWSTPTSRPATSR